MWMITVMNELQPRMSKPLKSAVLCRFVRALMFDPISCGGNIPEAESLYRLLKRRMLNRQTMPLRDYIWIVMSFVNQSHYPWR